MCDLGKANLFTNTFCCKSFSVELVCIYITDLFGGEMIGNGNF